MLEHEDEGSACTLPLPPPLLLVLPLLLPPPPPPQPAAAIASTANSPITPTALKLRVTLPPPSPRLRRRCSINRGSIRSGAAGRNSEEAPERGARRFSFVRTMRVAPKWRNWQTRRTQNPVPFGECGFDSHLRHVVV